MKLVIMEVIRVLRFRSPSNRNLIRIISKNSYDSKGLYLLTDGLMDRRMARYVIILNIANLIIKSR